MDEFLPAGLTSEALFGRHVPGLGIILVVGVVLVAEGFGHHVPKGYVYFAMAFSFGVELLNIHFRKKTGSKPVKLREPSMPGEDD
jgi:predicted tellurium resistance membrane protein TerC